MNRPISLALTVFCLFAGSNITAQTTESLSGKPDPLRLFDGQRAMQDLVKQVEGGPRLPDSPGIAATRQLISETLASNGFSVDKQDFTVRSPLLGYDVPGQNLYGIYPKGKPVKFVISAHYDTRPYADQDPDPARQQEPVPGANDGASGVAVLLELARCLPKYDLPFGVALVFFDVEDHGTRSNEDGFCLGSKEFARNLPAEVKDFQYGINLDMVAEANVELPMEGWSKAKAPKLTYSLWGLGAKLYPQAWKMAAGPSIYDDHMPFIAIGKQYIDVIDIQYPAWHTTSDTPDKCSAQSLDYVGDTILSFIINSKAQE